MSGLDALPVAAAGRILALRRRRCLLSALANATLCVVFSGITFLLFWGVIALAWRPAWNGQALTMSLIALGGLFLVGIVVVWRHPERVLHERIDPDDGDHVDVMARNYVRFVESFLLSAAFALCRTVMRLRQAWLLTALDPDACRNVLAQLRQPIAAGRRSMPLEQIRGDLRPMPVLVQCDVVWERLDQGRVMVGLNREYDHIVLSATNTR